MSGPIMAQRVAVHTAAWFRATFAVAVAHQFVSFMLETRLAGIAVKNSHDTHWLAVPRRLPRNASCMLDTLNNFYQPPMAATFDSARVHPNRAPVLSFSRLRHSHSGPPFPSSSKPKSN
ncbi:hypothetical protein IWX92DRAFT_356197 [Phyllosticta citricarpa]